MNQDNRIPGGYYMKARCIQDSEISHAPPHIREIWDWLIKEVNHTNGKSSGIIIKRGQTVRTMRDIQEGLHWMVGWRKQMYKKHQCEYTLKWLRNRTMITTRKTTRGMIITVSNYDKYQNPDNYEYRKSATRSKTVVQQPYDTINKNGKKEKNKYIAYVFDVYKKYVDNRVELTKEVEEAIDVVLSRYSREDLVGLIKYKAGDEFFQENNTKRGCTWFFGNGKFGQWMEEYKLAIKK